MKKLLLLLIIPFLSFGQEDCEYNHIYIQVYGSDTEIGWSIAQEGDVALASGGLNEASLICVENGCYVFNMFDYLGDGWLDTEYSISIVNDDGGVDLISSNTLYDGAFNDVYVIIGEPVFCGCNGYTLEGPNWSYYLSNNDPDNDGICTQDVNTGLPIDNCAFVFNPLQEDSDLDGTGDVCENGAVGCMDEFACNYSPTAVTEESCGYEGWVFGPAGESYYESIPCCRYPGWDCGGEVINDWWVPWAYDYNCDCVPWNEIQGCTDETACNYDDYAAEDDGSCAFPGDECALDGILAPLVGVLDDNCECVENVSSINEWNSHKTLIKVVDVLGRETANKGFQLHIYDDGTVEKKYVIK